MAEVEEEDIKSQGNPIIEYDVICPICDCETVKHYALRAKSLMIKSNIFQIPLYEDSPKYKAVDYNEIQGSVCPQCYYMGNNKADFHYFDTITKKKVNATPNPNIIKSWKNRSKEIEDLIFDNFVDEKSFLNPRSNDGILAAAKLNLFKNHIEVEFKLPYSIYKRARTYLKYNYFQYKFFKKHDEETLKKALEDLELVYYKSDFPEKSYEMEVCFIIVAIAIKLGDESKAGNYIKLLDQIKGEMTQASKNDPRINLQEITKWLGKAKALWQQRDDSTLWDITKAPNLIV
jgi:hypothetical protein